MTTRDSAHLLSSSLSEQCLTPLERSLYSFDRSCFVNQQITSLFVSIDWRLYIDLNEPKSFPFTLIICSLAICLSLFTKWSTLSATTWHTLLTDFDANAQYFPEGFFSVIGRPAICSIHLNRPNKRKRLARVTCFSWPNRGRYHLRAIINGRFKPSQIEKFTSQLDYCPDRSPLQSTITESLRRLMLKNKRKKL